MSDGFGVLRALPSGVRSASDQPWYFDDVVYDRDTAADLMHGLVYGAIGLSDALALLERDIPTVVEDWEGGARLVFDEEMRAILTAGHQLAAVLSTAGSSVWAAYEFAYEESLLREELRAAYEADPPAT